MIIRNAIKCKICGDIIESFSVHDYKVCSCGACAVDGGHEYLRRSAKSFDDIIELKLLQLTVVINLHVQNLQNMV